MSQESINQHPKPEASEAAYFGHSFDGDGLEARVIVGENQIEVRSEDDEILSIWAPYSYSCNKHKIPMRCYFAGEQWIAPKGEALAMAMDRFLAPEKPARKNNSNPKLRWVAPLASASVFFLSLAIIGYFVFQNAFTRLVDDNIASRLDSQIEEAFLGRVLMCDQETEPVLRSFVIGKANGQSYFFAENLGVNVLRMPTGRLAIDSEFAKTLGEEDNLIALLNLTRARNAAENPAILLVKELSFFDEIGFLRSGELTSDQLEEALNAYKAQAQISFADVTTMDDPLGNFAALAALMDADTSDATLSNIPSGLSFGERDRESLFATCRAGSQDG